MSVHRRVAARNRGLQRASRLTSLTLSGGIVLSGGFAFLAGHAYAGHSRRPIVRRSSPLLPSRISPFAGVTGPTTTTTAAPLGAPSSVPAPTPTQTTPQTTPQTVSQTVPQTVPQYYYPAPPDPVVSGGS
jgi:hypothetical protein